VFCSYENILQKFASSYNLPLEAYRLECYGKDLHCLGYKIITYQLSETERIFAMLSAFSRSVNDVMLRKLNFIQLYTNLKLLEQYEIVHRYNCVQNCSSVTVT